MESLLSSNCEVSNSLGSETMSSAALGLSANGASFSKHHKFRKISCEASTTLGMGRKKNKTNFYKVLSLESETVGLEEIKRAYRRLALRYHPDVCPPSKKDESTRMFVELQRAYETLSNPVSRREHDLELNTNASASVSMRSEISRETWEDQLRELVRRSEQRERQKPWFGRK